MIGIWSYIEVFGLFFARTSAFIFTLPVLGNQSVPLPAKIGLSGFIAYFLMSGFHTIPGVLPGETIPFILMAAKEVLVGLILGFITKFLFNGVQIAGEVIGMQMGFGMARVMDPGYQIQLSVIGEFQMIVMLLFYLTLNGHHFMIQGLVESYDVFPVTQALSGRNLTGHVVYMAADMFSAGVKIGAPVIVALLLSNVVLGILARTVPQMNVFLVGMPMKIGVGLLGMMLTMGLLTHLFRLLWQNFQSDFIHVIGLL